MERTLALMTSDWQETERQLGAHGGRITVRLPGNVVLARVPRSLDVARLPGLQLADDAQLDEAGRRSLRAYHQSRAIRSTAPAGRGLRWDEAGRTPPRFFRPQAVGAHGTTTLPTSVVMNGAIAIGLVIVSGPSTEALNFTESEIETVVAQCLAALDFLSTENPEARIRFTLEITPVDIDALPLNQSCGDDPDPCEAVFRDPALETLGYPPGMSGSADYAAALQSQVGEQWACVAYFTKYPTCHFAYAYYEHIVMQYDNDGWGPENIHTVFAHEACHIFGAADEYEGCECGTPWGCLQAPNNNCVSCSGTHLNCLMDENTLALCRWSRRQIGWNAWSIATNLSNTINGETSSIPALAVFEGNLWMSYRDKNSDVLYAAYYDGSEWPNRYTDMNDALSSTGPALAAFDGKLWATYKSEKSTNVHYSWFSGSGWSKPVSVSDQNGANTSSAPALAEYNGSLWMALRADSKSRIYACSFDGSQWSAITHVTDINGAKTSTSPALAVFGGKLWMAFRGDDTSRLYTCTFDGSSWSAVTDLTDLLDITTDSAPRLGVYENLLWLVFRDSKSHIFCSTFDGTNWLGTSSITDQNGATSSSGVGLAPYGDALVGAFRGTSSDIIWSISLEADADGSNCVG